MEKRRNVRAGLTANASFRGTDRWGKPFEVSCQSLDFSRRGLGLVLPRDIVAHGALVFVELPGRLRANAIVQWVRCDNANGRVRMGVRLVDARTSLRFRIAACILLSVAFLSQFTFSMPRWMMPQPASKGNCNLGADQMRSVIDEALSRPNMITDMEKEFARMQHEQLSCEDYTRLFEQSTYYKSPGKREAMAKWHRETFHSRDVHARTTIGSNADATSDGSQ
jgi:hypothetical protein